jgi:hypothetical protein
MLLLICIAVAGTIAIGKKPVLSWDREESILTSIRKGFRFVWKSKEVLGAMSLDLFAVFFGGATALLPYFADVILKVGPQGLGMLRSAPALGSVVVLMAVAIKPLKKTPGQNHADLRRRFWRLYHAFRAFKSILAFDVKFILVGHTRWC